MNTLGKILLFVLVFFTFSSCIVHPRPWKHWTRKRHHTMFHYKRGNIVGGRKYWVRQR